MEYKSARIEDLLGRQLNDTESKNKPTRIFYIGPMRLPLRRPLVSIIGSREASKDGIREAEQIAKFLIKNNATILGGLARGIDTAGHKTAIEQGGRTVAVLGTPLDRSYPKENAKLQDEITKHHLAVSQYPVGHATAPRDFALRNYTMALLSDAAVIVDAGDSSGSLYHGRETLRLGRPLFLGRTVSKNTELEWPGRMRERGAMDLGAPSDILEHLQTAA